MVIDALEVVNIYHNEGKRSLQTARPGELDVTNFEQPAPVVKTGERICQGQVLYFFEQARIFEGDGNMICKGSCRIDMICCKVIGLCAVDRQQSCNLPANDQGDSQPGADMVVGAIFPEIGPLRAVRRHGRTEGKQSSAAGTEVLRT